MVKCTCGQSFKNGTGLSAHQRFHCKGKGAISRKPCDCDDGGDWEVLTKDTEGASEYLGRVNPATGKKYTKYCSACKEVS